MVGLTWILNRLHERPYIVLYACATLYPLSVGYFVTTLVCRFQLHTSIKTALDSVWFASQDRLLRFLGMVAFLAVPMTLSVLAYMWIAKTAASSRRRCH